MEASHSTTETSRNTTETSHNPTKLAQHNVVSRRFLCVVEISLCCALLGHHCVWILTADNFLWLWVKWNIFLFETKFNELIKSQGIVHLQLLVPIDFHSIVKKKKKTLCKSVGASNWRWTMPLICIILTNIFYSLFWTRDSSILKAWKDITAFSSKLKCRVHKINMWDYGMDYLPLKCIPLLILLYPN